MKTTITMRNDHNLASSNEFVMSIHWLMIHDGSNCQVSQLFFCFFSLYSTKRRLRSIDTIHILVANVVRIGFLWNVRGYRLDWRALFRVCGWWEKVSEWCDAMWSGWNGVFTIYFFARWALTIIDNNKAQCGHNSVFEWINSVKNNKQIGIVWTRLLMGGTYIKLIS